MELLLWRWSTGAQVVSALLIAVFFAALSRSVGSGDLRPWVRAWGANLGALGVTLAYWALQPPAWTAPAFRGGYLAAKSGFVALILHGAWSIGGRGPGLAATWRTGAAVALLAVVGAFALPNIPALGVVEALVIGVAFGAAGVALARRTAGGAVSWLAAGLLARAALAVAEAAAYAIALTGGPEGAARVGTFLAAHSAFDSAAEWLLALGCVLALSERARAELVANNAELRAARETLRQLADRDALTGLANRRALAGLLAGFATTGASVLFLDLDGFKEINDVYGHHAGDECLARVAAALRDTFDPSTALVRYAGDEFVVVTAAGPDDLDGAIDALRARLARPAGEGPGIEFSVGSAALPPGGDASAALRAADEAMYRAKGARRAAAGAA